MLQQKQIGALKPPESADLKPLRQWLERPEHGDNFLVGRTEDVWDVEKDPGDLISIAESGRDVDIFTRHLQRLATYLQRSMAPKGQPENRIYHVPAAHVTAIVNGLSTVLASLLPALSILVLYVIKSMRNRLAMILVFTTLVSITLVLFTRARRVEIFATVTA